MGSRGPIDISFDARALFYLWLCYGTVTSDYMPNVNRPPCLYTIYYGLSVAFLSSLITVLIPLQFSSLYFIPHHIYFTASKIFAIFIILSVIAKKESSTPIPNTCVLLLFISFLLD